jgi:hypothetical protein
MRRALTATVLTAAAVTLAAGNANAAVTPTLTALTSPADGTLHAEWTIPDDPAGFSYAAVRCEDVAQPITDMGRWSRWPGNHTEGFADTTTMTTIRRQVVTVQPGVTYRCYVTEIDVAGGISERSSTLDVTAAGTPAPDPTPEPSPSPTPEPTTTPTPSPSPSPTPTPDPGGGTVLWGTTFENETVDSVGRPPSQGSLGIFSKWFGSVEHDWDPSPNFCELRIMGDGGRTGAKYMRVTVGPSAGASANKPGRCQPQANLNPKAAPGQDRWYGWSQRLTGFDASQIRDNRTYFADVGGGFRYTLKACGNGPGNGLGKLMPPGTDPQRNNHAGLYWRVGTNLASTVGQANVGAFYFDTGILPQWHDVVMHMRWSLGTDGLREVWYDGVKIGAYQGATLGCNSPSNFRVGGIYEGTAVTVQRTQDTDNMRVGTSYAAVDPSQ